MNGEHTPQSRYMVDKNRTRVQSGMLGRLSLAELRRYLNEHAPGIPDDDVMLNWATVQWDRDATAEELANHAEREQKRQEHTEQWERETLIRLKEKYE